MASVNKDGARPIALVTGGNTGIGFETCKGLIAAGFHVIVGARSQAKADEAIETLLQQGPPGSTAESLIMDLASFDSIRKAAEEYLSSGRPLNVCVLNAGVMALPWGKTVDGFEQQWQVNALGHFLFARLLLPAIEDASDPTGRIVHVSSGAHRRHPEEVDYDLLTKEHQSDAGYEQWFAYGRSKLANIMLSNELARRLKKSGSRVVSNAMHPGDVNTGLWTKIGRNNETGISAENGARTSIYLATSPEVEGQSGGYYFKERAVTTIFDEEAHRDKDYVFLSATRTETSLSIAEGKRMWAAASRDVGLGEEL